MTTCEFYIKKSGAKLYKSDEAKAIAESGSTLPSKAKITASNTVDGIIFDHSTGKNSDVIVAYLPRKDKEEYSRTELISRLPPGYYVPLFTPDLDIVIAAHSKEGERPDSNFIRQLFENISAQVTNRIGTFDVGIPKPILTFSRS